MDYDLVRAGLSAGQLLENYGFKVACERLRKDACDAILASSPDDIEGRERTYNIIRLLDNLVADLSTLSLEAEMELNTQEMTNV